ncbi:Glucosidase 2 subunit beta [Armadillidium vulgare]|nr:Glucosidase 2 subunit beta [Armadillidium vulgare]
MTKQLAGLSNFREARIEELLKEKEKAQEIQAEKLSVKEAAEALEKEALEEYKAIEEEIKARQEKERKEKDENDAREAFEKLDEDNDGLITIQELQANQVFDTNRDGEVSEIEAQPVDTASEKSVTEESDKEYQSEYEGQDGLEDEDGDGDEEDEENEDYADEVEDLEVTKAKEEKEEEEEEKEEKEDEIQYDPETQRLIDVANAARDDYKTADDQLRDIIKEIQNLQDGLTKDFGPNDEFRGFEGRCYEYSDREYVYKLCPFDSATQKQKNGHGETRLGSWGSWTGPAEDPYSIMKYTAGQGCWNGPQRSAEVRLTCGIENELTSVTEPNRCEYLFLFTTPAICNEPENSEKVHQHTEL